MSFGASDRFLLVVDQMPLRRAQLVQFLRNWAEERDLGIVVSDLAQVMRMTAEGERVLAILSIGAEELREFKLVGALRVLKAMCPGRPIAIISETADRRNVGIALMEEVSGFIPASVEAETALAALDFILAGGSYFPADVLREAGTPPDALHQPPRRFPLPDSAVDTGTPSSGPGSDGYPNGPKPNGGHQENAGRNSPEQPDDGPSGEVPHLTPRQIEVLECLRRGHSNKQIARDLNMSEATVKVHVRQLMKRLGAANRTHAAVLAVQTEALMAAGVRVPVQTREYAHLRPQ